MRLVGLAVAFCVSLLVVFVQVFGAEPREPVADEYVYLTIANDLNQSGIFTDAWYGGVDSSQINTAGRFFAPAYPLFLAAMAKLDPLVGQFIRCHAEGRIAGSKTCPTSPVSLLIAQSLMAAVMMTCVFFIAFTLSGSHLIAGVALLLALATEEAAYYAGMYLTENLAFLGFYLFLAAGVAAIERRDVSAFALAGAAIALATLARPSYQYLLWVVTSMLVLLTVLRVSSIQLGWRHVIAFMVAALLVLAPWTVRNWLIFGDPALSSGYGGFILVQRVAYNAMTWPEWVVAFVYWLPDFGDDLSQTLFNPKHYERLGFNHEASFYNVGNSILMSETLRLSGGRDAHLDYLLRHYVIGDLAKHVLVTIPLTLRGIWVGQYLSLAGILLLVPVMCAMARQKHLVSFAFLALALLFMAGLHGFVSVNVPRYNSPLITLYALIVAYSLVAIVCRFGLLPGKQRLASVSEI